MAMELNNLIDKIKKDGVEQAESDAAKIIADVKTQARGIIDDAQEKAQEIIEHAKEEASCFKVSSEKALKQAARDALLALRGRVTEFFARIIKTHVQDELSATVLKDIIMQAIEYSIKEGVMDIEIVVSERDKKALEKKLFAALRKEAKEKVLLKTSKAIEKGFRIGERGKDSYLDFTDQAIAEGFKRYLNPKLADALDIDLGLKQEEKNAK